MSKRLAGWSIFFLLPLLPFSAAGQTSGADIHGCAAWERDLRCDIHTVSVVGDAGMFHISSRVLPFRHAAAPGHGGFYRAFLVDSTMERSGSFYKPGADFRNPLFCRRPDRLTAILVHSEAL